MQTDTEAHPAPQGQASGPRRKPPPPASPRKSKDVLTAEETADMLRVEIKTVRGLAQRGGIPVRKVGRVYRFSRAAVLQWLLGTESRVALKR